jgi:hypothetical protein
MKITVDLFCPPKLSLIIEGEEIITYYDKQKLKEFMTTEPALQKTLKGIMHTGERKKNITMRL